MTRIYLVLSHGHQDHWGLIGKVSPQVPVYIGEACAAMLRAAVFFSAAGIDLHPAGHLGHRKPLQVGPFTVTPFLNDHNGFDAYSMLVEAGGKKLFYSGNFQGHGRKSDIFEEMLRKPPTGVDVMLMEGTNLQDGAEKATPGPTEKHIEAAIVNQAAATAGMVLVTYSAQNIDRLVTLYRAAKRSNRHLVLDLYTAAMAEATGNKNIPKPDWDRVLVYVPQSQRLKVLHSQEFDRVDAVKPYRIFGKDLKTRRHEVITTFRMSMAKEFESADCLEDASAVWALWAGYLKKPSEQRYVDFLDGHGIPIKVHHSSGHAHLEDLQRMATAVSPRRLVPIHSFATDRFKNYFDNVEMHADGEWWEV